MAFGAVQKFPNDTRPRVGIGVDIPFSAGGVFTPNYTTQEAIKNNIVNFFLTNPGERPGNPQFGGGLRSYIFSQINSVIQSFGFRPFACAHRVPRWRSAPLWLQQLS